MTELIRNDHGKIVAQKVKRADGVEMLVPPPTVIREPAFTVRELEAAQEQCTTLKKTVLQSTSTLRDPVLTLTATLERVLATLEELVDR